MAASIPPGIVGFRERPLVAPAMSQVQQIVAQRKIMRLFRKLLSSTATINDTH
jgi:hypothetical protein